ncbi:unnamed protein product [Caenorhabditis nigoni]|uniref:Uncharacterized protein n=1 Tax=Caenorhabditis nigoni TaxID=1611254 RepID=A0A2G5SEZ9_9PELO|nr:hypothetical protein B9Z55_027538 [Caenorhabditis nigoni]
MDQRRKSFKTVNSGSDENLVQVPDRQHHDSDNTSSRLRDRRSTRFGELSTSHGISNTSNVKTVTKPIKEPNFELSTKDRQALKRLIIALGNKYGETIVLHEKASMEVEKLEHEKNKQEKEIQKLKRLQKKNSHGRNFQNRSYADSFRSDYQKAQDSLDEIKKNLQKAKKIKACTGEDMEEAEADWKFEAMCSGEAYYEDGKWKWRY